MSYGEKENELHQVFTTDLNMQFTAPCINNQPATDDSLDHVYDLEKA